jgi:hypothetical protein
MRSMPLDRTRLDTLKRDNVLPIAGRTLHVIQNERPEEMVAATAILFALVCNRVGLSPEEMHHKGMRMMRDQQHHDKTNKLLQSLRDFAGLRIAGQEVTIS